jgi:hypothetical protein
VRWSKLPPRPRLVLALGLEGTLGESGSQGRRFYRRARAPVAGSASRVNSVVLLGGQFNCGVIGSTTWLGLGEDGRVAWRFLHGGDEILQVIEAGDLARTWLADFDADSGTGAAGAQPLCATGAARPGAYGWIGQQPGSGFSDQSPATLGVFASLDRF